MGLLEAKSFPDLIHNFQVTCANDLLVVNLCNVCNFCIFVVIVLIEIHTNVLSSPGVQQLWVWTLWT